ncbi:MAG: hypothetical protein KC609_12155 [Myxococcales bacterium]|nr:hypothetical protein [Myxococcales bacterium]
MNRALITLLAATLVVAFGCGRRAPEQRIRVYVPKEETPTKAPKTKTSDRRRGEELYSSPGRLKSSGIRIFAFLVPKGMKRSGRKSSLITMEALLPLADVARFYQLRTDEYIVVNQGRGFKVLSKAKLGNARSEDYRGPTLYINRNSEGMARLVFFEPKAPSLSPTANNTPAPTPSPDPSPSPSPSPTPTPSPSPAPTGTGPTAPSNTISMKPSKMTNGPSRYTPPTSSDHKPLDLNRMPPSLQNAIKAWELRNPGKKFEM